MESVQVPVTEERYGVIGTTTTAPREIAPKDSHDIKFYVSKVTASPYLVRHYGQEGCEAIANVIASIQWHRTGKRAVATAMENAFFMAGFSWDPESGEFDLYDFDAEDNVILVE